MTADEMIVTARLPVSEAERVERIKALREVLIRAQREHEELASHMALTNEVLSQTCSI